MSAIVKSLKSAHVRHQQSGAGAVARTVEGKLRESASVQDFGAVGGGMFDETAAFVAALAAHKVVQIPPGHYRLNPLIIPTGCTLIGQGESSILDFTDTVSADPFLSALGELGSAVLTTGTVPRFTDTIDATGHGLSVGEWFRIISTVDANSAEAGNDRLGDRANVVYLTETHQVQQVVTANQIKIRGATRFAYPIGSALKRISGLENVTLKGFKILCGGKSNKPFMFDLGRNIQVLDLVIDNAGSQSQFRGCFDGSIMDKIKAYGQPSLAAEDNLILLQATDGCSGVRITNFDVANGGQLIDVSYTPALTATIAAPSLDTYVGPGVCRNAGFNAITDHPCADGTTIADVTMMGVKGGPYIRSRNATVTNVKAWGRNDGATSIGVYAGENGYWRGLRVSDCHMHGFDRGYLLAGTGTTIEARDIGMSNNRSTNCRVGEEYGNFTGEDCGIQSRGSQHTGATESGFVLNGSNSGISITEFVVRGPSSNAGVQIAGDLKDAVIQGKVIGLGASVPSVRVASGTPKNTLVNVRKIGAVGMNVGLTKAMVSLNPRQVAQGGGYAAVTGVTTEQVIDTYAEIIPPGTFNETAYLRVKVRGSVTGTAGTKTVRMYLGSLAATHVLPTTANITFLVEFVVVGTGDASQIVHSYFEADGDPTPNPGAVARTINMVNGSSPSIRVQLENSGDAITVSSVEIESAWA